VEAEQRAEVERRVADATREAEEHEGVRRDADAAASRSSQELEASRLGERPRGERAGRKRRSNDTPGH
jgi:hypothetical protein